MADLDDVRGVTLAGLNAIGMAATIVGVPVVIARRATRRRPTLLVPAAVGVATVLTVATQQTGWSLVKLWLGIDRPRHERPRGAQDSGRQSPVRSYSLPPAEDHHRRRPSEQSVGQDGSAPEPVAQIIPFSMLE